MIYLLIGALLIGIISGYLIKHTNHDIVENISCITCFAAYGLFAIILLATPLVFFGTKVFCLSEYPNFVQTVADARESESEIERAALIQPMIEMNNRIARYQYWNNTIWKTMYYDGVDDLEFVK